jgi:DNA-binding Lrp family transcriptional regulator
MDKLDWLILRNIKENCRISHSNLGFKLDVSGGTVKTRMSELVRKGIVTRFRIIPSRVITNLSQFIMIVSINPHGISHRVYDDLGAEVATESVSWDARSKLLVNGYYRNMDDISQLVELCKSLRGYRKLKVYPITHPNDSGLLFGNPSADLGKKAKTILKILQINARCSIREISRITKIAEKTVRRYIQMFAKRDIFHFTIEFDPSAGSNIGFIGRIRMNATNSNLSSIYRTIERYYVEYLWETYICQNESTIFVNISLPSAKMISDILMNVLSEKRVDDCCFYLCSQIHRYPNFRTEFMNQILS